MRRGKEDRERDGLKKEYGGIGRGSQTRTMKIGWKREDREKEMKH